MFFLLYYIYKRAQLGAANLLGIKEEKTETEKSELAITFHQYIGLRVLELDCDDLDFCSFYG